MAAPGMFAAGSVTSLFFRDHRGTECDLLIQQGNAFIPVEIESSETFMLDFLTNLRIYTADGH
jgi:hypothetical protein